MVIAISLAVCLIVWPLLPRKGPRGGSLFASTRVQVPEKSGLVCASVLVGTATVAARTTAKSTRLIVEILHEVRPIFTELVGETVGDALDGQPHRCSNRLERRFDQPPRVRLFHDLR